MCSGSTLCTQAISIKRYKERLHQMEAMPLVSTKKDIFDLADSFQYSAHLFTSYTEGLYEICAVPVTYQYVSQTKGWVEWKTEILLNGLVALGLLKKNDEKFVNSTASKAALERSSSEFIGDLVEHNRLQWDLWKSIPEVLKDPGVFHLQQDKNHITEPYALATFQRAMQQLAHDLTPEVLDSDAWKNKKYVLDLAGGHGLYLIKLAEIYPNLNGEIWDLPEAKSVAEEIIEKHNVGNRIKFKTKDISDINSYKNIQCDGVMFNHCLHHFSQEQVRSIMRYADSCMKSEAYISVVEATLEDDCASPPSNALFSSYMMVNRKNGRLHPTNWIAKELTSLGYKVDRKNLDSLEGDTLLKAKKP